MSESTRSTQRLAAVRVLAFEPMYENYTYLVRNIRANDFCQLIDPYQLAITSKSEGAHLQLSKTTVGSAKHQFGSTLDQSGIEFEPAASQPVLGLSIDSLVSDFGLTLPTHIKIDVDGLESDIVAGAQKTMQASKLRSILIEINERNRGLLGDIEKFGFDLSATEKSNHIFVRAEHC